MTTLLQQAIYKPRREQEVCILGRRPKAITTNGLCAGPMGCAYLNSSQDVYTMSNSFINALPHNPRVPIISKAKH